MQTKGITKIGRLFVLILSAAALAACGGSGAGGGSEVRSLGEIEALGSIIVNGVKFEIEGGQIIGLDNTAEDLKPGRVVLVEGRVNDDGATGRAARIKFEDSVKGPLTALDEDGTIAIGAVMGQTVIFEDNITRFDPATGLPLGDDVNKVFVISGFERDDGKIQATYAGRLSDDLANFLANGGVLEVKGTVSGLNASAQTFMISGLTVDYSNALLRDLPGGLQNGLLVEVKGSAFNVDTNTLTANDIEGKARRMGDDIARAQVEGFVADLNTGARTFTVNGQTVDYSSAAFRAGIEADLANGVKVEAQGPLANDLLQASRVTFKESVRIEADVLAIDTLARTITLQGLTGLTIIVHPELTRGAGDLALLAEGNEVKIRAREAASGLIATRLEKIDDRPGGVTIIQGPVTAVNNPTVTILGTIDVNTTTINNEDFKDHDRVIGRTVFFQTLQLDDIVKARFRNGRWDQIEFQD